MIGYLQGTVQKLSPKELLILTSGGVGYAVHPAGSLLARCKEGAEASVQVLTIVRENEIALYGFGDEAEKTLFTKLISVSGIGPKIALQIVSTPVDKFLQAVESGDVGFVTQIPGLGKKTAERLIVELRGKLDLQAGEIQGEDPAQSEAIQALQNLGYDRRTIDHVLKNAPENANTEDLVKYFLTSHA